MPIFFTGFKIARWEGWLFLAYYAFYVLYLILDATQHDALPLYSTAMLIFVVPVTVLTLAVSCAGNAQTAWSRRPRDSSLVRKSALNIPVGLLLAGLVLLIVGAEALVHAP